MNIPQEMNERINKRLPLSIYFHSIRTEEELLEPHKQVLATTDIFPKTKRRDIIVYLCKIDSNPREVELNMGFKEISTFEDAIIKSIIDANTKEEEAIVAEKRRKMISEEDKMYFVINNTVLYIDKKDYELNILFNEWLDSKERFNGVSFDTYKDGKE